jgi:hypothetical protein
VAKFAKNQNKDKGPAVNDSSLAGKKRKPPAVYRVKGLVPQENEGVTTLAVAIH